VLAADLRPQLNVAYGMTETITPNLDKFAESALVFHRAYCQQAVCSPSRNSFMSGRRPDTTKVWNFINHFREKGIGSEWMSLPQWFKEHDYITLASGKLFHPAHPPQDDYPTSWTTDPTINPWYWGNQAPIGDASPCSSAGINSANITHPLKQKFGNGLACYNTDSRAMADDDNKTAPQLQQRVEYAHRLATRTIEYMAYAKAHRKNFYIGVGIRKPHLPWRHPKQFWDLYEGKSLTTAKHQTIGENITTLAFERNGGQGYSGTFDGQKFGESPDHDDGLGPLPEELQAGLRRGYYASVSFMDHEVGRVLDELDTMGFTANTAVLFHGVSCFHGMPGPCARVPQLTIFCHVLQLTTGGSLASMAIGRNVPTGSSMPECH
jgi:iduronate 2-sulfatase